MNRLRILDIERTSLIYLKNRLIYWPLTFIRGEAFLNMDCWGEICQKIMIQIHSQ